MPVVDLEASRRLREWLGIVAKRVKKHECPLCETNDWAAVLTNLGTVAAEGNPFSKRRELALIPMPVLILVCKHCGYTRLHNIGLTTPEVITKDEETSGDSRVRSGDDRSKSEEVRHPGDSLGGSKT